MKLEIECSLCKNKVDSGETFYQEEEDGTGWRKVEEAFICKECQEKRLKDLLEATPQRMLELIRMGHPTEKGEPYRRGEIMDEIRKRPEEIFDALKWPRSKESKYKNRFTGDETTLAEMAEDNTSWQTRNQSDEFNVWFKEEAVFILEHWLPKEIWNEADVFEEYRTDTPNKLTGWLK